MDLFGITIVPDNVVPQIAFLSFAGIAVLASLMMITRRNAVHSALWLVVVFFQIAGVYVLLNAPFLAALQVLVYTGAILVLILFVIMLLQLREGPQLGELHKVQSFISWPVGILLAVEVCAIILLSSPIATQPIPASNTLPNPGSVAPNGVPWTPANMEAWGGASRALGIDLYTDFLLPFEVASLILLVAVIGAILLAGRLEPKGALEEVPTVGISLGRRGIFGTPQDEQFGREVRREIGGQAPSGNGGGPHTGDGAEAAPAEKETVAK